MQDLNLTEDDIVVNELLYTIYLCVMEKKIKATIVAKNAIEFDMIFGSVRIERNKNGFTVYCNSIIGNFKHNIKPSSYLHVVEFLYIHSVA